jgi:hypothetical protein
MNNKVNSIMLAVIAMTVQGWTSTIVVSESNGTVEVYLANNSQITAATVDTTGTAVGNNLSFRIGTFTGGFIPTANNYSSWFSNFVGVNGFIAVGGSSLGRLTASITAGDSQAINSPVTSNTGVGVNGSASIAKDSLLYAIVWNTKYTTNASGGNVFDPTSSALQAAILTNSSWTMPLSGSLDVTTTNYSLSTGTTATVGSIDLVNKGITLAALPEPSSSALMMIGGLGLLAMRRMRKV